MNHIHISRRISQRLSVAYVMGYKNILHLFEENSELRRMTWMEWTLCGDEYIT